MATPSELRFDELDSDYEVFSKRIDEVERKIEARGRYDLEALARAGWDREAVLRLLALAADENDDLLKQMRTRRAALESFARRLRTLSLDAKRILKDPLSKVQGWAWLHRHLHVVGMPESTVWNDVVGLFTVPIGMRWWAEQLDDEAKLFGRYLRAFGRVDSGVVLLLVRCWMFDKKIKKSKSRIHFQLEHFDVLARLLTDAFECVGKHKEATKFSADGLRQLFNRHGRRTILLWLKFSEPPPPPQSLQMPPNRGVGPLSRIGDIGDRIMLPDESNP
jgi:hypothetical protein